LQVLVYALKGESDFVRKAQTLTLDGCTMILSRGIEIKHIGALAAAGLRGIGKTEEGAGAGYLTTARSFRVELVRQLSPAKRTKYAFLGGEPLGYTESTPISIL
jgi:hypothetical protein